MSWRSQLLKKGLTTAGVATAASGLMPTDEAEAAPLTKALRATIAQLKTQGHKGPLYHGTRTGAKPLLKEGFDVDKAARPETHKPRGMFFAEDPLQVPTLKTGDLQLRHDFTEQKKYLRDIDRPNVGAGVVRGYERPGLRSTQYHEAELERAFEDWVDKRYGVPHWRLSIQNQRAAQDAWTEHLKQQVDVVRIHGVDKTPKLTERIYLNPNRDVSLFWTDEKRLADDYIKSLNNLKGIK